MKTNNYFKEMRHKRGMTQEDVSKFLGYASKQIVSNWERGTCMPPLNKLAALVKLLELDQEIVMSIFLEETKADPLKHLKNKKRSA